MWRIVIEARINASPSNSGPACAIGLIFANQSPRCLGFALLRHRSARKLATTNHMGVMESGENPEQSRCGIRIQVPTMSIVRKGGEDGDEA